MQDDPINFPLSALNRELGHDSFQYSTNKKKTDSKQYFSNYGKLLQNFNIPVLMGLACYCFPCISVSALRKKKIAVFSLL